MRDNKDFMLLMNAASAFNPLSLAPSAWYDPSDTTTLFQDTAGTVPATADGHSVARINDKSGNAHHLIQATGTVLPVLKIAGSNYYLDFTADVLSKLTGSFAQPLDRISGIRQISWVSGGVVYGGESDSCLLWQFDATPELGLYSGSVACDNSNAILGSDFVITERFNGASSSLQVDKGTAIAGNPGATAQTGMSIGGKSGLTQFAEFRFYGMFLKSGTLTAPQIVALQNYYAAKQGRVI